MFVRIFEWSIGGWIVKYDSKRNYSRWWHRFSPPSPDTVRQQAIDADLRQTDDLLSVVDPDAGWHSRNPGDNDARGPVGVSPPSGRRQSMGGIDSICGAA